ncbi:MAG: hypothetical protein LKJ76_00760 [Lachnospiraceae bacterium]|nr:hypothetical protein [Lachnospiraceae bacterium]
MIIDALNWAWMALACFLTGKALLLLFSGLTGYRFRGMDAALAAGTVALTVYSEIFSLFGGVGTAAGLLLAALLVLCAAVLLRTGTKETRRTDTKAFFGAVRTLPVPAAAVILLLFFWFLARSAMTPSTYDDYLYHAQALEWIEKYGAVPGLGNLHSRFAYNSAFLCLQALFSWRDLTGQSLHTVNSFYAFLLSVFCVSGFRFFSAGHTLPAYVPTRSELLRGCALVWLFSDPTALTGLDTDPLAMMAVLYLFIRWSDLLEQGEKDAAPYGLLSVLAVSACTMKLSAAPLLLFSLYPLVLFLRARRAKQIVPCLLSGAAVAAPYLIRNVILSGYLLYPYAGLDLFRVDWKMPLSVVTNDRQGIVIWARSLNSLFAQGKTWAEVLAMPLRSWFPVWFRSLSHTQELLFAAAVCMTVLWAVRMLLFLLRRVLHIPHSALPGSDDFLWGMAAACFLFWFFTAPLIRYGSLYLCIVTACGAGVYNKHLKRGVFLLWLLLFTLEISGLPAGAVFRPEDYGVLEDTAVTANEVTDGNDADAAVTVYTPVDGDRTDYAHFPSSPSASDLQHLRLRGPDIRDGFRSNAE